MDSVRERNEKKTIRGYGSKDSNFWYVLLLYYVKHNYQSTQCILVTLNLTPLPPSFNNSSLPLSRKITQENISDVAQ
jgi:hypothetical protein